jgi:CubicO group peptidase (beta-lactamase class C family)
MRRLRPLLGLTLLATPTRAQPVLQPVTTLDGRRLSASAVDSTITAAMARERVTGLAVAIINRGKVVYLRAFGERNAVSHEPLTTHSTMYAASLTKPMFAHLVLQLAEQHVLELDRPVVTYTGPLDTVEKWSDLASDPRHRKITARMLLSHTSGFSNFRFLNPGEKLLINFEPGSRYAYSGEGLNFLQYAIERITSASLTTLMREKVFQPLGMSHTSMVWDSAFLPDLAMGHDSSGAMVGHARRSAPRAAGSADTNIEDMARYLVAMLNGTGLTPASRRAMLSSQVRIHSDHQFPTLDTLTTTRDDAIQLSYGLGWGLITSPYGRAFFKEGHDDITNNHMIAFDGPRSGMIVMSNSGRGNLVFPVLFATLLGDRYSPWVWNGLTPAP